MLQSVCLIYYKVKFRVLLFQPARAFGATTVVGVLRGGGDVRAATVIDLLPLWTFALPLAALAGLAAKLGIFWVYLSVEAENIVKFFLGIFRFRSGGWIHDVLLPNRTVGSKMRHALRLPPFPAASKAARIKYIISEFFIRK